MIKPGESCSARFVGEFATFDEAEAACSQGGDVAVQIATGGEVCIVVRCAICEAFNHLPTRGPSGWALAGRDPVTIQPSVKTWHDHRESAFDRICHYVIASGVFNACADSTPRGDAASP